MADKSRILLFFSLLLPEVKAWPPAEAYSWHLLDGFETIVINQQRQSYPMQLLPHVQAPGAAKTGIAGRDWLLASASLLSCISPSPAQHRIS